MPMSLRMQAAEAAMARQNAYGSPCALMSSQLGMRDPAFDRYKSSAHGKATAKQLSAIKKQQGSSAKNDQFVKDWRS